MGYVFAYPIFFVYICVMENKLTHIGSIHTTHDVKDYYICMNKRIVMEKVQRENNRTGYYTYSFVEFFSNENNPKEIIEKIKEIQRSVKE